MSWDDYGAFGAGGHFTQLQRLVEDLAEDGSNLINTASRTIVEHTIGTSSFANSLSKEELAHFLVTDPQ